MGLWRLGAGAVVQFCAGEGGLCGGGVAGRAALCTEELEDGGGPRSVRACHGPF